MTVEIYWASGSPFAWRALLALEHKGVPYESRLISFNKREHRMPDYLAMNPRGKVPVLRDGDVVVYESLAVLGYLEKKYPTPALFGDDPAQAAVIWRLVAESLAYMDEAMEWVILPLFFGGLPEKKESVESAARVLHQEFGRLDALLADGRPWLAGEQRSAADLITLSEVELVLRAASRDSARTVELAYTPFPQKLPRLAAWLDRFRALPEYERTYPPHWKD